jgi:hypothetical protein
MPRVNVVAIFFDALSCCLAIFAVYVGSASPYTVCMQSDTSGQRPIIFSALDVLPVVAMLSSLGMARQGVARQCKAR